MTAACAAVVAAVRARRSWPGRACAGCGWPSGSTTSSLRVPVRPAVVDRGVPVQPRRAGRRRGRARCSRRAGRPAAGHRRGGGRRAVGLSLRGRTSRWPGPGGCGPWPSCGSALEAAPWWAAPWPGRARWPPPRPRSAVPVLVDLRLRVTAPSSAGWPRRYVARAAARPARGWHPRWWPSPARTARRRPRATSPTWSARHATVVASPGQLQQPGRPGPGRQRAPGRRDRGVRGRDGHLRPRGDRRAVPLVPARRRGDHRHRPGAPRAVRLRGPRRRGQGRDPRGRAGAPCSTSTTPAWPRWPRPWPTAGPRVWRVSARDPGADVCVVDADGGLVGLRARGRGRRARCASTARPGNLAGAVAVALALGVPADDVVRRLPTLPGAPHRLEPSTGRRRRHRARRHLQRQSGRRARRPRDPAVDSGPAPRPGGWWSRRGWSSSGPLQGEENAGFAADGAAVATDLVVVGRTNRRALLAGPGAPRRARAARGWWW